MIEYTVPPKMIVGRVSKVMVKIHGYSVATNATSPRSLTAQYMKVLLLAEDPSGLKVVSEGKTDIQYVPKNKTAEWVWSVTPLDIATNQKLQVRVFDEYKPDGEQDVDEESYTVNVTMPSALMMARETYIEDPEAWWKYWLPSGISCLVLIWLFQRLIDPRKRTRGGAARSFQASDWI